MTYSSIVQEIEKVGFSDPMDWSDTEKTFSRAFLSNRA